MEEGDPRTAIDRGREALAEDPTLSARATELRVVFPLLKSLGWEIHGPEVAVEYAVELPSGSGAGDPSEGRDAADPGDPTGGTDDGGRDDADRGEGADAGGERSRDDGGPDEASERSRSDEGADDAEAPAGPEGEVTADYALLVGDDPAVLVETVAAGQSLDGATVDRLSAAVAAGGADLGLATNGHSFAFLAARGEGVERAESTLAELAEDPSPLSHYTRAAAERRRRRHRRERRRGVAEDLSTDRESAVEAVGEALAGAAGTDLDGELAAAGEAFVDRVVDALSNGDHPESAVAGSGDNPGNRGGSPDDPDPGVHGDSGHPAGGGNGSAPTGTGEDAGSGDGGTATAGADAGAGPEPAPGGPSDGGIGSGDDAGRADGVDDDAGESSHDAGGSGDSVGESSHDAGSGDSVGGADGSGDDGDDPDEEGAGSDGGADGEEYVVRFFNDRASVGAVGHATPAGAMAQAVDYLIDRHALGNRLRVPWGPEDADGRAIIGREPVHPDGTEMTAAAELSEGYYLYTDLPPPASRTVVERLASKAGLRVMFQGDWAEG